jgi:protein-disulfide isomerase
MIMNKLMIGGMMLIGLVAAAQEPVKQADGTKVKDTTNDVRRFVSTNTTETITTTTRHGRRKKQPATIKDTTATIKVDMVESKSRY